MSRNTASMAAANLIIVPDSPAVKRRRTEGGFQSTGNSTGYNSEEDSGDDLFEGITSTPPPSKYFTQPTQILERPAVPQSSPPPVRSPDIQIPASSPFRPQPVAVNQNTAPVPGRLASIMAPAGTSFRTPHGVVRAPAAKPKAKPILIDLLDDDDGPTYKGGSSDDDAASRANIRPSSFVTKASNTSFGSANGEPSSGNSRFSETMQSFKFGGPSKAGGGFPGTSTSINGLNTRPNGAQNRPARALGVEFDVTEEEEPDLVMRRKIRLVRSINPEAWSVITCRNAIMKCKGSVDDAAALLAAGTIELTDDDEIETPEKGIAKPKLPEPQMKAQLKAPVASIQARYSHNVSQTKKQSIPTVTVDATPPPKPKRKLMQGRRHASSPAPIPSPKVPSPQIIHINSDHEDYDSGVASEPEEDIELEGRVLKFLNTCTAQALADLTNIKETVAITMVNARPFSNLEAARSVSDAAVTKTGKRSTKAPVGEKVVQVAIDMWSGYEAVDALVARCEQLGKPLTAEMNKWPVDMFGEPQGGVDLSTLDVEDRDLQKDSAIGTPTSKANSHNGDVADDDVKAIKSRRGFLKEPKIMNPDYPLKKFQYVGLNWLALLYKHKLSCILADDMGLGKTCQVITFLSYLVETGVSGPHLVIVPPSTLENWLREFAKFSPSLVVEPYYGSQAERQEAAERMLDTRDEINVVVSTYEFAAKAQDNKFMRRLRPEVCVYDEGHVLKNPNSQKYQGLIKIPASFRLLLTGTPLQNNLMELAALLGFILPEVFQTRKEDLEFIFKHKASTSDSDHAALLSQSRIDRAKAMLTPFVLRRKKDQVLKDLPIKVCRVEYCDLEPAQMEIYDSLRGKARERAKMRLEGVKIPNDGENNPLMQLRKAAIHPMLFRRHFTDDKLEKMLPILKRNEPEEFSQDSDKVLQEMKNFSDFYLHLWCGFYPSIKRFDIPDLAWMNSGKVQALVRLLDTYKANGDRVLVFSQFTLVLDILEAVLQSSLIHYTRFDGSTKVNERQTLIDQFRDDESITAFLLSTGAGGTGLNLTYANKVVIFDSSFNPQDDVQAESRAHRVGQTRPVEVVRLITKGTIEEQIYALGQSKLELDSKVAGDNDEQMKLSGEKMVAKLLLQEEEKADKEKAGIPERTKKDPSNDDDDDDEMRM